MSGGSVLILLAVLVLMVKRVRRTLANNWKGTRRSHECRREMSRWQRR
jgi:hypothetical protein